MSQLKLGIFEKKTETCNKDVCCKNSLTHDEEINKSLTVVCDICEEYGFDFSPGSWSGIATVTFETDSVLKYAEKIDRIVKECVGKTIVKHTFFGKISKFEIKLQGRVE